MRHVVFVDLKGVRHGFLAKVNRCKMDHLLAPWQLVCKHNLEKNYSSKAKNWFVARVNGLVLMF